VRVALSIRPKAGQRRLKIVFHLPAASIHEVLYGLVYQLVHRALQHPAQVFQRSLR
jgi:hypothetical protein